MYRKRGSKNKDYLASFDNYHLPGKNTNYHLVIWHGHLWGGRFQMSVMGERQVSDGNVKNSSGQEVLVWTVYGRFLAS
jgi:hypothetical protein